MTRPRYAFCETVYATSTSPHHLRVVGPEGLLPHGGVPGVALCGRDLMRGWDLAEATPTRIEDRAETLCVRCRAVYEEPSRYISRRRYLTMQAVMSGADIFAATAEVTAAAAAHPEWDLEYRTWAEWESPDVT